MTKIFRIACIYFLIITAGFAQNSKPKNIIILIGDGMGPAYVSASVLSLDNDPYRRFTSTGFSVTCSADNLITDSAAGATALSTGYRTNNGYISVSPDKKTLTTIFEIAEKLKKSTGVVVTSSVTNATPAGFVAHDESRGDEFDIAKDFLDMDIDVVIGAGRSFFTPKSDGGKREDGLNLITNIKAMGYDYFNDADNFLKVQHQNKFYALLDNEYLPSASKRNYNLGQLTDAALKKLSTNKKGFVLMVEGSQIDWAGHAKNADYVVSELHDFNTAINTALNFAEKDKNTLVLVIADHETGGMAITKGSLSGKDLEMKFNADHHTASMVGVFTKGPGEEQFRTIQDNYIIGRKLINLVDGKVKF